MRSRVAFFLVALLPALTAAVPVGTYEYRLSWNGLPAAEAVVAVSRGEREGAPYRVEAQARTNWFVDFLWSLRARVAAGFTPGELEPLGFRYDRRIRGELWVTDVVFGTPVGGATGTLRRRGEARVTSTDDGGVVDPVTAIFRALSAPLTLGERRRYEVFTGESSYRIELHVVAEERVDVAGRDYDAWRIDPRVWKIGQGLEPRLRGATIWVSKGPRQTILRVRSEVYIGAVTCDLHAAREG